jgi:nucleoid-associated protein YgaU
MIFKGSRYEKVAISRTTDADGRPVTALKIRFISATPADLLHAVRGDDRLDLLAFTFYGNPEKFWLIADANTEMDPEDLLEPGRQVRIPPDRS